MKQLKSLNGMLGLGAIALIGMAGCADRNNNGDPDSLATSGEVANGVDSGVGKMGNVAGNMAEAAGNVAEAAGNQVGGAVNGVVAASQTPDIKNAIAANGAMKGSNINVDTKDKTVTLSGTVKSPAQKTMAGNVAKQKAAGFKIVNNLKIVK